MLAPSQIEELELVNDKVKTGIIKTGINFDHFPAKTEKEKNFNAIYVGRLAPEKNLDKLIHLFSKLPKSFKLTIVGDGPSRKHLEKISEAMNVQFVGYLAHENLHNYYYDADFHLITSESETFGFTPVESMACGTPVIYPNCHPFNDLYGKEFPHLMYDLKDDESFLKCVESFYSDFTGYNEKSSKFARDNFGWNSVINDLLSKLESTL